MDDEIYEWCLYEYIQSADNVGPENLVISNIDVSVLTDFRKDLVKDKLKGVYLTTTSLRKSLKPENEEFHSALLVELNIAPSRVAVLDEKGTFDLAPEDSDRLDAVVFGGILGDDPPKDASQQLRTLGLSCCCLEKEQMSTDTAVITTKRILVDKIKITDLMFVSRPEFNVNKHEKVELPFRYLKNPDGSILASKDIIRLTKEESF